tara:strand:+ start:113 stop:274 length:162 start_codon:yes stop_codon:yes gene_type:complete
VEILKSIEQEIAKAQNELKCANADIEKAKRRLSFTTTALHSLKKRNIIEDMKK